MSQRDQSSATAESAPPTKTNQPPAIHVSSHNGPNEIDGAEDKKGRSRTTKVAAALGLVLAVENVFLTTSGTLTPNPVADHRAAVFLSTMYFPAAVKDPVEAMNHWGTADFRALHTARGLDSYRNWYAPVQEIPANFVTVSRNGDSPDGFTVVVERILKSGAHDRFQIVMRLKCASFWSAHVPGLTCSADNLRLDFTAVTLPTQ
jgi:hypothetical protein